MNASIEQNTANNDDADSGDDLALIIGDGKDDNEEEQSEKSPRQQRFSSKITTALMGVTIGILFTVVVALVASVISTNKKQEKTGGLSYTSTVLSSSTTTAVYENVTAGTNEDDEENGEESSGESKDEFYPEEEGKVKIPIALNDMIKKWTTIKTGDNHHTLNIPADMIERMNGHCNYFEDFELSPTDNYWQCDSSKDGNGNFPYDEESAEEGTLGYTPSDETYEIWSKATGVSVDALRKIHIGSGVENHKDGLLCSMPLPPKSQQGPRDYWKTCVQPRAGFFNTLTCKGLCTDPNDDTTCSTSVSMGFAFLDANVCYPAHQHYAEEGYWQIGGRGWWRTWADKDDSYFKDKEYITTNNVMGSKYPFHAQRQNLPHEMDTTSSWDGDGNIGQDDTDTPMVMIYFWGMSNKLSNEYQFVPELRDSDVFVSGGQGAGSCGNTRRIPGGLYEGEEVEITVDNC